MESMTPAELDCTSPKVLSEPSRVLRWSLGSGRRPEEVLQLLDAWKMYGKYATSTLRAAGMPKSGKMPGKELPMDPRKMQAMAGAMSRAMPPGLMAQMGGAGGMQQPLQALAQMGGGGAGGGGLGGLMGGGGGR